MNRLKLLAAVALLGIPLAACEETTPPPPIGSIGGQVSIEGTGIDGVSVNLSNGQTQTTSGGGNYRFDNVEGGAYTVTISGYPSDATFDATSQAATIASADQSVTLNFSGSFIRTASVMGTVTVEGSGLGGVSVRISGVSDASATTDASGRYSFTGLRMGNYSVEISGFDSDAVGFSSTASSTSVGVGESKIVSFDGTYLRTAGVSGQVSVEGEGLNGVMVSLRGGPDNVDESTTTDAAGQYAFASLRAGTYTVGISGWDDTDFEFEVTSKSVTVALGETGYVEFEGELLRTSGLAGRVSVGGMGMAGVTVTLSGTADATANTDASGIYAFAGLAAGDYTVTISGYDAVEYSFDDSQTVTLEMDKTAIVNFDGMALRTASVKVMVTADGEGVAGVTATLTLVTGATSGTILSGAPTGADGSHTFGPLLAGNYRVDISGFDAEIDFADGTNWQGPVATGGMAEANFAGMINRTGSIAGMVTADGEGMGGVTVTLGGAGDASAMTADDGSYSFSGLRRGDYTVSIANPDDAMYSFPTTSRAVSVAIGQMHTDVSFAGTMIRRGSISGQVSVEGMGLDSVTVTLSGAHDATTMTDASGQYAFSGLGGGAYTVSMTNPSAAAYTFEHTSADVMIGNAESKVQNFTGMHTRTASISGMLYVDEAEKNDMYDDGEDMLAAAGVELALIGPSIAERRTGTTGEDGSFSFGELRKGSYQLQVAASAMIPADYGYGGPATGYDVMVAPGEAAMQNVPFDITHTTVSFSVMLKSGDETGDALPGAMVMLYADDDGEDMVGEAKTDEMGMASIRFAREGTSGNMVYAMVASDDYMVDDDAGMQAVMWDPKSTMADASNAADITNMKVDVTVSGATITTEYDGGDELAGWAIGVTMGTGDDAKAVEGAPAKLDDDGMAAFMTTVDAVPATFTFAVADDQDDKMDGGEKYEGTDVEYVHTGLSLMGTMDAGTMEVMYTTQTLKVYVHHEMDQIEGYSGNILGGDKRTHAGIDVNIRYIADNGRSRTFAADEWVKGRSTFSASNGVVTFSNVPASAKVIVVAEKATGAGNIMLMEPDELSAYDERDANGAKGGSFGAEGGFHHTMELCPLTSAANNQDGMLCSSFAFVSTHNVSGLVWKKDVVKSGLDAFTVRDGRSVPGQEVSLKPVENKNLAGEVQSHTTTVRPVRTVGENAAGTSILDERIAFAFNGIAAGVYNLDIPAGWTERVGEKGAGGTAKAVADALNPLKANLEIDVTPETGTLYGRVNGSDGFPIDSVTVSANGQETVTDRFGRYIIDGINPAVLRNSRGVITNPSGIRITAAKGGLNRYSHDMDFADTRNNPTEHPISVVGTALTTFFNGSVTHNGSPVAGAEILVDYDGDMDKEGNPIGSIAPINAATRGVNAGKLVTGADGTFSAQVRAGSATAPEQVTVTVRKYAFTVEPFDGIKYTAIVGQPSPNLSFNAFANATIEGRVVGPGGPVAGVKVTATTDKSKDETTTGATGIYILNASAGTVTLTATSDDYDLAFKDDKKTIDVYYGQSFRLGDITATDKADPKSDDAKLSALSLGDVTLSPAFVSDKMAYTANAEHDDESVTVTATANHGKASVDISPDDADTETDGHQVSLTAGGATKITVEVTAEDGSTEEYTVTVSRAPNDDATLSALSLGDDVTLNEPFASGTMAYTANAEHDDASVTVTATPSDGDASVAITPDDADTETDGHQVPLAAAGEDTEITVNVTAENGSPGEYTVTVSRAHAPDNATLSELSVMANGAAVDLDPVFTAGMAPPEGGYEVAVKHDVEQITLSASATHPDAKLVQDPNRDDDIGMPGNQLNLDSGPNEITVTVTAADGTTKAYYKVTVTRLTANATLRELALTLDDEDGTAVPLDPVFAGGMMPPDGGYSAEVEHDAPNMVTVVATASNDAANVTFDPEADLNANMAGHQVDISGAETRITVTVTGADADETTEKYTIAVKRAEEPGPTVATLSALSVMVDGQAVELTPAFKADMEPGDGFEVDVDADVSSVTVTATATDGAAATVDIRKTDADEAATGGQVELGDAGTETEISVKVTAKDDETTTETYTITVSRAMHVPTAPQDLEVDSSQASGRLAFSWGYPARERGLTHFQYRIAVGNDDGDWTLVTSSNGSGDGTAARRAAVGNLRDGEEVTVWVRAVQDTDSNTESFEVMGDSASATGTPWPDVEALTVGSSTTSEGGENSGVDVTVTLSGPATSATTVALDLTIGSGDEAKDASDRFNPVGPITFAPGSTRETVKLVPDDNEKDDDADPVVTINAMVTNMEAKGRGPTTAGATVTIEDDDYKPGQVQGVTADAGDKMVTLKWTDLVDFDDETPSSVGKGNGTGFTYQYRYKISAATDDDAWSSWDTETHSDEGVVIGSLSNGVPYTFQVRAVSSAGEGEAGEATGTPETPTP